MNLILKNDVVFVLLAVTLCFTSSVHAVEAAKEKPANTKDSAMGKCITEKIKESSIIVSGSYSDPGGHKAKSAKEACEYEKTTNKKEFEKIYGAEAKSKGN